MSHAIPISTDGRVSAATQLWRYRGRLQLTVVVKSLFTITPDAVATPAGPGEIVREDRTFGRDPTHSVEVASDLAPYRARCDVTFVGHAYAAGGRPVPAASVRLAVAREGRSLLDKVVHVFGERRGGAGPEPFTRIPLVYERAVGGPGEPNPVGTEAPSIVDPVDARRPAGLAPIHCFWPTRKRLLGKLDRRALAAPVADIPDDVSWDYFQVAPPDQQINTLRGGEWLVLDGLHPSLARVQTRLPAARAAARVVVRAVGAAPAIQAIEMVCDALAIDGDRLVMAMVWRGRYEVAGGEEALASLGVAAALEIPGEALDWGRLATSEPGAPAPAAAGPAVGIGGGTMAASPEEIAASARRPTTPFAAAAGAPATPAAPPSTSATPWDAAPARAAPGAAGDAMVRPVGEGTYALPPEQQAAVSQRALAPFAIPAGTAPPSGRPVAPGAPWSGPTASAPRPAGVGQETMALGATQPVSALLRPLPAAEVPAANAPPSAPFAGYDALFERLRGAGVGADEAAILLRAIPPPGAS